MSISRGAKNWNWKWYFQYEEQIVEYGKLEAGALPYSKVRYVRLLRPPFQLTHHIKAP